MSAILRAVKVLQGGKEVEVEVRTGSGKWGTVVWLLGAVMASEEEKKEMEGKRVVVRRA
jgi:hypothetical protein